MPHRTALRSTPSPSEGNELRFCGTCAFSRACLGEGLDKAALRELQCLVEHIGPFQPGEYLFREGDPFTAIAAVRTGTVKTFSVDSVGREQVLGFFLPGEVIGFNAIHGARFPCSVMALDTVMLCRFSFPSMAALATRISSLQSLLFRLLSQEIKKAALLAGDFTADERVAAFLLGFSRHYASRGYSAHRFTLAMPRADIANYLRLAAETVSRVMRRFQDEGLIAVNRREVELLDIERLEYLAQPVLR
ncbi:helix-turn-helix domain-containing protein [Xanthomonadaceae bacterium JHOS43]|nr:helix-turn-helix domain-containing protein [Xanthomonadaceae bacterium JHOS43]